MADNKEILPPQYDVNAKMDACIDLTVRRFVYSTLGGAVGGLLLLRSPVTIKLNTLIVRFLWTGYQELVTSETTANPKENALYKPAYTSLAFVRTNIQQHNHRLHNEKLNRMHEMLQRRSFHVELANPSTREIFTNFTKKSISDELPMEKYNYFLQDD